MHKQFFIAAAAVTLASGSYAADWKTAEETYKNIVELKSTRADQLVPAMQFMASSLGVECSFCHVQGKPEADDKGEKKTARQMIAMTLAINKNSFNGRQQVTCYSCHRGNARPVAIPPVLESDAPPAHVETAPAASTATVDEILAHYVTALGGKDAIQKVTSRVMKGNIVAGGSETPIEVFTKAPNQRITVTHSGTGESYTAFDGKAGWMGSSGRPARDMSEPESQASSLDAEFYLALRLKELYPHLRRGRPESIGSEECEILNGTVVGRPSVRLYFDKKSGLLVRMVRYTDTPVGRNPTQIDYADYRAVDGVQMPFRWTLSRPNGRFTIQIQDAKANVAIADSQFAKR